MIIAVWRWKQNLSFGFTSGETPRGVGWIGIPSLMSLPYREGTMSTTRNTVIERPTRAPQYRTRRVWAWYLRSKPSHIKATASTPYPCDMIVSYHFPPRIMAYTGLPGAAEYDVLDYSVPGPNEER